MAMTIEERERFDELRQKVEEMEDDIRGVSSKINSILNIVRGIAIGLIIGAVIFGYLKINDLIGVAK